MDHQVASRARADLLPAFYRRLRAAAAAAPVLPPPPNLSPGRRHDRATSTQQSRCSRRLRDALVELFEGTQALRQAGLVRADRFDLAGGESAVGTEVQ